MIRHERPMSLIDAMILVAATAAGLAWIHSEYEWPLFLTVLRSFSRRGYYLETTEYLLRAAWPIPLAWTLATFTLRFRKPRPPRWRLASQPGFVASGAAVLASAMIFAPAIIVQFATIPGTNAGQPSRFWQEIATGVDAPKAIGLATCAAWLTLALGRRWRPHPGWIDRLGRAWGYVWIAFFLILNILESLRGLR